VIIVEHEVDRAARLADRIIVMDGGEIIADGTPRDVLAAPGARQRTANERLPSAADFTLYLKESGNFPSLQPTLDLDRAIDQVSHLVQRAAR
jgi:energy-coupling factor transporter ATP-binding protein EcfA2